ncbi:hypothetical protein [Bradyrhizobium genosp. P]|uniref:hypothetical protein n=1 Tax=Bradyrhizobium genosp. P TaxID=83641 RepID=UPI003CEBE67E
MGAGVVDPDLKHRKTPLQFDRAKLSTFLGAEFGLEASVDLDRETCFGQFGRSTWHSKPVIIGVKSRIWLR